MIRLAFVVPWALDGRIEAILQRYPAPETITCHYHQTSLVDLARYVPPTPCDAIISRGYNADMLESRDLQCPVIRMKFSSIEVINAVFECKKNFNPRKIAVIGPISLTLAMRNIIKFANTPIEMFVQSYPYVPQETEKLVKLAVRNGCDTIVGGGTAYEVAKEMGRNAQLVASDDETIWEAIDAAVKTVIINRHEREKHEMLQTVMDHSREGIMFIDTNGRVRVRNTYALRNLPGLDSGGAGTAFPSLVPELAPIYEESRRSPTVIDNEILSRNGISYSASFVPVMTGERRAGTLFVFRDVGNIQEMEAQIRKKIHARGMTTKYSFESILSRDQGMHAILETAEKFAAVDSNVIIEGETGTGKELFAQSIHHGSSRSKQPFVAINCAALPEHLLESELFGYSGGSFTGAAKEGKKGLFELAHNGTLFLDEVSELPFSFQGKLLRALEEGEIRRIGDDRIIPVNVRVIAATNKNLRLLAERGAFREDLYFRLNVLEITIPPLRDRPDDIFLLFSHFLAEYSRRFGKNPPSLGPFCKRMLSSHPWRGNVRELKNMAERVAALHDPADPDASRVLQQLFRVPEEELNRVKRSPEEEKKLIAEALAANMRRGDIAKALRMSRATLWRKMRSYNLIP